MRSRKYLFYMYSLLGGGAERVWALLASEFARRGHDVTFAMDFAAEENSGFLDPAVRRVVLGGNHAQNIWRLSALIRAEKPDVTLSGIGASNLKHLAAAALAGRARRAVISYHGFFPSEPELLSCISNHLAPVTTRFAGRAIAVSDGLLRNLVDIHRASPARTMRIYNPVDTLGAPEALHAEDIEARLPVVLFVGRFAPDKDIATLLRAFSLVKTPGARFEIVGDGPQRPDFERLVVELGLNDRLVFRGYMRDPSEAYRNARCFVISSIRESFGNVVAEALAHGLPVVSTAAAGPVEILDEGRFGTIVPLGDHAALARGIDAALADPGDPAPRMGRARDFAIARVTDAYLAMTEDVIASAAG